MELRARGRRFESGVGQMKLQSGALYEIVLFIFYILDRDFFKKNFEKILFWKVSRLS